jgi:hypothetical protein
VHFYEVAGRHDRDIELQGAMRPAQRPTHVYGR